MKVLINKEKLPSLGKIKKHTLIALAITIIILIATNPTNKNFKEHLYANGYRIGKYDTYERYKNYLIFSIYRYNKHKKGKHSQINYYVGILKNLKQKIGY